MMGDTLMTIREMSEAFGVTPRALRFYEASGLLSPQRHNQSRLYDKTDRARLKLILRGKRFGFTLDKIREILELYNPENHNLEQTETALAAARERLVDMRQQCNELAQAILELDQQIKEGEASLRNLQSTVPAPPEEG